MEHNRKVINTNNHSNVMKLIEDIIREKKYQTITVKVHDGKVVRIVREESIKPDAR